MKALFGAYHTRSNALCEKLLFYCVKTNIGLLELFRFMLRFTFWENVNNYVREFTFLELNEVIRYSTKPSNFITVINSGASLLSTLYFIRQRHLRLKPIY